MSIFIDGMEMPKGCAFCRIGKRNGKKMVCPFCDDEWDIHDPMSADHRLDNCPLAPVPPHGRLIDVKSLENMHFTECMYDAESKLFVPFVEVASAIFDAPTIIPAEEEST